MDLRNLTDKASQRIKAVFSKNNRFFYGTPEHQEYGEYPEAQQAPIQGVYANEYAGQPAYPQQPQRQQANYQQMNYQQQAMYQQPVYQQAPYQAAQAPVSPQGYTQPYMPQSAQAAQWQAPAYPQESASQHAQPASPQQAQLYQTQQAEQSGRNRRAAQHTQGAPAADNIVQFPGAQQPEAETRSMDAYVVNITSITGCRQAMTCLRKGQCTLVVMDQLIDKAEVRRYVDMLSGACFALGGTMTRLSQKVGFYILAPNGMMVYTDPLTASANAPARPQPQAVQQQPAYQQSMQQPAPYAQQQTGYAPQQAAYAQQQAPYQQQAPQPYQAHPQNPYAPPMNMAQPEYAQEGYDSQRFAQ